MSFIVIIPARLASTRLPQKPLVDIHGKPMILHMMKCALESGADRVIIATDHISIASVVVAAGGEVCMTSSNHKSGTERLAEVVEKYQFSDNTIIVNLQGDEPMLPANSVRKVASNLEHVNASITTLASSITDIEIALNPNIVKVVMDANGFALYFSRAAIPWSHQCYKQLCKKIKSKLLRHIGIYAYRVSFLRRYAVLKPSPLENIEFLEQLRVLWYGEKIHVDIVKESPILGVDTLDDLEIVRRKINISHIMHHT